ncbi:hypothetical protein [Oceanobacillus sp. CF4.6]|uniref:hypothetical protein n=1 Tax=Oceanobacillus sp. CF4.6 TaxID=3373080 RepID=UPI003EE466C4
MRAKINLWGNEYVVSSIDWYQKSNRISHVSFEDENGDFNTIHGKISSNDLMAETNRYSESSLCADFSKVIIWKED